MKTAILQVADQGPLESLVVMLQSAGWNCALPSHRLRRELIELGCDTVLDPADLARGMGYDMPFDLPLASQADMARTDILYVDVKAHRSWAKVYSRWPHLERKILWYRINGGKPEVVPGCGDEVNPPCPVLTPNLWYRGREEAYACWPPFYRWNDYYFNHGRAGVTHYKKDLSYGPPVCLIHNIHGWGYGLLVENMRRLGVKCYGVASPDGLIQHKEIPEILSNALCMVHLKSSDAPGYALYESLAAGCPAVVTRRLIWRNRMEELFVPDETCLVFDRETHEGLSEGDVETCTMEVRQALEALSDPKENQRIGNAGRARLSQLMWNEERDGEGFKEWMGRMFQ